jgi:sulfur relay (sulfurtransferase) complex TusBCD TusD component (DsrE family)
MERETITLVLKEHLPPECTCADARAIGGLGLIEDIEISTKSQLAQWVVESDRVRTF